MQCVTQDVSFFPVFSHYARSNHDDIFRHHQLPPRSWKPLFYCLDLHLDYYTGGPFSGASTSWDTNTNTGCAQITWCHLHSGCMHAQWVYILGISTVSKYLQVSQPWWKLCPPSQVNFPAPLECAESVCCSLSLSLSEQHIHCRRDV